MIPAKRMTLGEWAPREFHEEYRDTPAYAFKDVEVVEERSFGWPGVQVHVMNWVILANGKAVGWNENPSRGWSFPVMSYGKPHQFKRGDTVRLKKKVADGDTRTAKIENFYTDIEGGVILDTYLAGFRSWNISDLDLVEAVVTA